MENQNTPPLGNTGQPPAGNNNNIGFSQQLPQQPETRSPVSISPPPRRTNKKKWILIGIALALLLAILTPAIVVLGYGKTAMGENFQDEAWQDFIMNAGNEAKDISVTISYQDEGSYYFQPSKILGIEDDSPLASEFASWDEEFSFNIDNVSFGATTDGYFNFQDTDTPVLDLTLSGSLGNNQKDYRGYLDVKLTEEEAYAKYDYNDEVKNFFVRLLDGYDQPDPSKNRWEKAYSADEIQNLIKIVTQQESPKAKSRDAKRVSDMRQIASALELYYNDNNSYPGAESYQSALTNQYMGYLPTAPTPADGNCTEDMNNYYYQTVGSSNQGAITDYKLTFCLGTDTGNLSAGNNMVTPAGIEKLDECPAGKQCIKDDNTQPEEIEKELSPHLQLLFDNRLFSIKSLKGITLIDKTPVLHYSLKLEKEKLRAVINGSLDESFDGDTQQEREILSFIKQINDIIIDKMDTEGYEVWVGATNKEVYKTQLSLDAISITGALTTITNVVSSPDSKIRRLLDEQFTGAAEKSRDAKRVADARQIVSALELYYNDNNAYPPAQNGKPLNLVGTYLGDFPVAPEPPDGDCDSYYNEYWYTAEEPIGDGSGFGSYQMSFCIGETTGSLPPGIIIASPRGITPQGGWEFGDERIPAPAYDNTGLQNNDEEELIEVIKSTILEIVNQLEFDRKIEITIESSNIGEIKTVEPPADYYDPYESYPSESYPINPTIDPVIID